MGGGQIEKSAERVSGRKYTNTLYEKEMNRVATAMATVLSLFSSLPTLIPSLFHLAQCVCRNNFATIYHTRRETREYSQLHMSASCQNLYEREINSYKRKRITSKH